MLIAGLFAPTALAQSTALQKAEAAFAKSNHAEALPLYLDVLENAFAPPRELALANCRVGIIHSIQSRNGDARSFLEKAVAAGNLPRRVGSVCSYALLQVYAQQNAHAQARDLVRRMGELDLPELYRARSHALAAEVGARLGDGAFEALHLQKLLVAIDQNKFASVDLKILGKSYTRAEVTARLGLPVQKSRTVAQANMAPVSTASDSSSAPATASASPSSTARRSTPAARLGPGGSAVVRDDVLGNTGSTADAVWASEEGVSPDGIARREARAVAADLFKRVTNGQNQEALAGFQRLAGADFLVANGLGAPVARVQERLARLAQDSPRDLRIGLLVPAASSFARFKHKILRAASAFAGSVAAKDVNVTFRVRAVANEPGAIEEATLALLLEDHVHALAGPLSNTQALGAAGLAEAFAVPLFAFGPVTWSPELSSSALVRMGVLARSQAEAHLRHLQEDLRFANAGVFAPNDAYGYEMAHAFAAAAKRRSFGLDRLTSFDVTKDVFQEPVVAALGSQDSASRKDEFRQIEKEARKKALAEKRKFDPSSIKLPARVTFDALYVPDTLARAKIIASTFAFNEAKQVRYLGDRTWPETPSRPSLADRFLNGARTPQLSTGSFLSFLRRELSAPEGPIDLERQAFDAFVLLRQAQYKAAGNNGAKLLTAMRAPDFTAEGTAVYGAVDERGEPFARMLLYGYKNGRFTPELMEWVKEEPKAVPSEEAKE